MVMMNNRLVDWLRFSALIASVGVIAGLGAVVFRDLIGFFHNLFFYGQLSTSYDVLRHAAPSRWGMGIIFVPVVGAAIVAFLVKHFAPEAKGHGVPEVMDAIHYEHGRIRPVVALVKSIASSISIGSGGSIGREGPIVQIGAAFGSAMGQWVKVEQWQRITLVACGAGGGIAATFNTPVGGILFAVEIMLTELSARTVIPVMIATAIATCVSYVFMGDARFIPLPLNGMTSIDVNLIPEYLLLGALLGLASFIFIRGIYFTEDLFDAILGNYYLRHMLGMFLVGVSLYCMMLFFGHYYVQGVGYATVMDVLTEVLKHPGFLLFLALLKLLDTSITLGSGGSGGIFSPLLFIGAALGGSFVAISTYFFPSHAGMGVSAAALAGMAGMVGASTGAPITAVIMSAEMVSDFNITIPLMLVVGIAYAVRRAIMKDSVYTLKLTRRGHPIP